MAAKLSAPYLPARRAVEQLAQDIPTAAAAIEAALAQVDAGAPNGGDALRAAVDAAIEATLPLALGTPPAVRWDAPGRWKEAYTQAFVEDAFQLLIAHLDI